MEERGNQRVFLSTPTLTLPPAYRQAGIEKGEGNRWKNSKYFWLELGDWLLFGY
jgi:hypothetical protein